MRPSNRHGCSRYRAGVSTGQAGPYLKSEAGCFPRCFIGDFLFVFAVCLIWVAPRTHAFVPCKG